VHHLSLFKVEQMGYYSMSPNNDADSRSKGIEGDSLALVPTRRDVSTSKVCSEVVPQFLFDNLLDMKLTISQPVNGFFKYFSFTCLNDGRSPKKFPPLSFRP
jgi:hypothetical protein